MENNIDTGDIYKAFQDEYQKKHAVERKGFWGAVNRFYARFDIGNDTGGRVLFPAIGVGALGALGSFLGLSIAMPVLLPVMFCTVAIGGASYIVVSTGAIKSLNQDITDGKLTQRYVDEVLKPKKALLQQQIEQVSKLEKGLSITFAAKADENKPGPDTSSKNDLNPPRP